MLALGEAARLGLSPARGSWCLVSSASVMQSMSLRCWLCFRRRVGIPILLVSQLCYLPLWWLDYFSVGHPSRKHK